MGYLYYISTYEGTFLQLHSVLMSAEKNMSDVATRLFLSVYSELCTFLGEDLEESPGLSRNTGESWESRKKFRIYNIYRNTV